MSKFWHFIAAIVLAYAFTWVGINFGLMSERSAIWYAAFAAANYMRIFT